MRKSILITWLLIVIVFSGLLIYSTIYEIDAYETIIEFKFQINEVNINLNNMSEMVSLIIQATIWNPSFFSSFELKSIQGSVLLNGQGSSYLAGQKWFYLTILPGENSRISWSYVIQLEDIDIFNNANSTQNWNWYFSIRLFIVSNIVEGNLYDRSQSFQGVKILVEG